MLGVAAGVRLDALGGHTLEGLVPVDGIVAPRLPGMEDGRESFAARIAVGAEPGVPGIDLAEQAAGMAGSQRLVPRAVVKTFDDETGDRRLREARGRRRPSRLA